MDNKAREINSPLIKQLIDETSPEELAKIDADMRSYADGYAEGYATGYKRALEVMEWYIKTHISGMVQEHISNINKKVDE
jgi:hypothetical protein